MGAGAGASICLFILYEYRTRVHQKIKKEKNYNKINRMAVEPKQYAHMYINKVSP